MRKLNLGKFEDELLVFGGAYSNLEALQALKQVCASKNIKPSNVFCTGDIAGYCANPLESYTFIAEWGIHSIGGNIEFNLRDNADECGCNYNEGGSCDLYAKQWYPFIQKNINQEALDYIKELPEFIEFTYHDKKVFILHGSYSNTSEFIFKSTPTAIKLKNFEDTHADIIIAGHSGLPFIQQIDNYFWVNPGVIGMPANDGKPNTWFSTFNIVDNKMLHTFHKLFYDHHKAAQKMIANNLPLAYSSTLKSGIWDNCDILPTEETNRQGQPIQFE